MYLYCLSCLENSAPAAGLLLHLVIEKDYNSAYTVECHHKSWTAAEIIVGMDSFTIEKNYFAAEMIVGSSSFAVS